MVLSSFTRANPIYSYILLFAPHLEVVAMAWASHCPMPLPLAVYVCDGRLQRRRNQGSVGLLDGNIVGRNRPKCMETEGKVAGIITELSLTQAVDYIGETVFGCIC